jgi:hypothetical protein
MKKLLFILTLAIFSAFASAYAFDPSDPSSEPSFEDGHWFHKLRGNFIHDTPNDISIQDGNWFHQSPLPGPNHAFTRDRYGNLHPIRSGMKLG